MWKRGWNSGEGQIAHPGVSQEGEDYCSDLSDAPDWVIISLSRSFVLMQAAIDSGCSPARWDPRLSSNFGVGDRADAFCDVISLSSGMGHLDFGS